MACPQSKNKLVGVRFPMHGIVNNVLIKQRGPSLAKPKLAPFVDAFYSHTFVWLPMVIEKTGLGMKLNLQVF
jgi:hypothetical protein